MDAELRKDLFLVDQHRHLGLGCGGFGRCWLSWADLSRSFVILTGLIKVLTSDNESTTSRAFCLHARWRLGSRASRQDQEVTSPAPEETSFCLQTVYLQPTLRAFYQFRSGFQPTRRRNFGLASLSLDAILPLGLNPCCPLIGGTCMRQVLGPMVLTLCAARIAFAVILRQFGKTSKSAGSGSFRCER